MVIFHPIKYFPRNYEFWNDTLWKTEALMSQFIWSNFCTRLASLIPELVEVRSFRCSFHLATFEKKAHTQRLWKNATNIFVFWCCVESRCEAESTAISIWNVSRNVLEERPVQSIRSLRCNQVSITVSGCLLTMISRFCGSFLAWFLSRIRTRADVYAKSRS